MLKGFIIGIGKIVPGVSGAMLAITLGVYDKAIQAFTSNAYCLLVVS
jgi:putative membrane protein